MATHRSELPPELIIPEGKIGRNILVVRKKLEFNCDFIQLSQPQTR